MPLQSNKAQQVYLYNNDRTAWFNGRSVIALKRLHDEADREYFRKINVAHDEVIIEAGRYVLIVKHY